MKIKVTADSTCDLPLSVREKYNIDVMPLHVALGEDDFLDGVTIQPENIYDYYKKTKNLPKSGARSAEEYKEFFKRFTDEGYAVIHYNISDSMSASHANAKAAASELKNVYTVDSASLSTGTALLMLDACDMAAEGMSAEEIVKRSVKRAPYVQASFVVDTLEFLYKGGRCSSLQYLGANLLSLKPCIEVKNGAMGVARKYMGRYTRCIRKYVEETLKIFGNPDKKRCFVTHTKMEDGITEAVIEQVAQSGVFDEIIETTAGCTITTHCGAGTLGILFINDGGKVK